MTTIYYIKERSNKQEGYITYGIDEKYVSNTSNPKKLENIEWISSENLVWDNDPNDKIKVSLFKFKNLDKQKILFIETFMIQYIKDLLDQNDKITIDDLLYFTSDYFSSKKHKYLLKEKLLGDLAEFSFILLLQENKINYLEHYQLTEKSLYDFYFDNIKKYVDIKVISNYKKTFMTSYRQMSQEDCIFIGFLINKVHGKNNIIQIMEKIKNKNEYLSQKLDDWKQLYKFYQEEIDSWTIDFNEIENKYILIDEDLLPQIEIKKENGLKEMNLEISITNAQNKTISSFLEHIKNSN